MLEFEVVKVVFGTGQFAEKLSVDLLTIEEFVDQFRRAFDLL